MCSTQKRILVTGASGLIGCAIKSVVEEDKKPEEKWIFVDSKDADLSNLGDTRRLFVKHDPTHVIHLTAMVGGSVRNLELMLRNIHINDNVLHTSYETNVIKVLSCLSTCIFPDKTTFPIDETMVHQGSPHPSNFGYSYGKRLIDAANHANHEQYDSMFTSVIPCNVFGPNDNHNMESSHVIRALTRKLHDVIEKGKAEGKKEEELVFTVLDSGRPLHQFIYSLDVAKLFVWMLREYNSVEPIILCVDEDEVAISDVADTIAKAFNFKGKICHDTSKADGQFKKIVSNANLRRLHPNFQFTPFEVAIKETVDWFKANHEIVWK